MQTEKLASLGQLTAGIAHEIKNPLNFVNNFSSLSFELIDELQRRAEAGRARRQDARGDRRTYAYAEGQPRKNRAARQARRFHRQEHALAFARGSGEHRPADINAIVEESLNLAYHGARAEKPGFNITLEARLRSGSRHDRPVPAGNYAGISQSDFKRLLCRHQAQGERAKRSSSRP